MLSVLLECNLQRTKYPVVLHVDPSIEHNFPWQNGEVIWFESWQDTSEDLECQVISEVFTDHTNTVYTGYSKDDFRVVPDSEILKLHLHSKKI